jgi:hypothetical protein
LLPDRLKSIFGGSGAVDASSPQPKDKLGGKDVVMTRQSRGLDQFFKDIRDQSGLSILDMGGACQENINFITDLGHRITPQSILMSLDETFAGGVDGSTAESDPHQIEAFLKNNLDYPPDTFDGVLLWDTLQFMAPPLLTAVLERIYSIVRPKSYLLVYFNAEERSKVAPVYSFRIQSQSTLTLIQRGTREAAQSFNNRALEKLFAKFESVKFFLTRESLREIIVRR